jgi:signal transduction histidine kinase/ActR/RegA family two-component response regulator
VVLRFPDGNRQGADLRTLLFGLAGRVPQLGLAARFSLIGAVVAIVLATGLAILIQDRLSDLLLEQLATRAAGEIALGFRSQLTSADFSQPVTPSELASLASRLDPLTSEIQSSGAGIIRIYVYGRDGTVLYSDVVSRRGKPGNAEEDNFDEAIAGRTAREVSALDSGENSDLRATYDHALEVYSPIVLDGQVVGVYEIYQDMAAVNAIGPLVFATVFGGFAILFFSLLLVVRGTADQINRELTERKRLEEQLRQSQKMEAIGQLAGGVAHDFNNLLTVIIGYAEILRIQPSFTSFQQEALDQILRAGESAASLTRQLLAFSRRQIIAPRELNLNDVIEQLSKMVGRLIGEDIVVDYELAPNLGNVEADPGQIEQIMLNLVTNARDAMPRGGKLTVSTRNVDLSDYDVRQHPGARPGPFAALTVRDTGAGIDPGTQAHIFEPFFTTKEVGKGTGLGLAAVHGIVKQSNGSIHLYSEPGRGTTFTIFLPRLATVTLLHEPALPEAKPPTGNETILIVEDDEQLRTLAGLFLSQSGYQVLEAEDGRRALELAAQHDGKIDLLLTDVVMPGMTGRVLAEELLDRDPRMRVLFISGYTDAIIGRHGFVDPGVNFLHKPFVPIDLAKKVRQVLDAAVEGATSSA